MGLLLIRQQTSPKPGLMRGHDLALGQLQGQDLGQGHRPLGLCSGR